MKRGQNTKLHIAKNSGEVLCGVKSHWMEAGDAIDGIGYIPAYFDCVQNLDFTCKKCLLKYLKLIHP